MAGPKQWSFTQGSVKMLSNYTVALSGVDLQSLGLVSVQSFPYTSS